MGKKEFIGLTLDGDLLKIARIRKEKSSWVLAQLDRISVKEETVDKRQKNRSKEVVKEYDEDFHFGIDEHYMEEDDADDDDLTLLSAVEGDGNGHDTFNSNVAILKQALEEINRKKVRVGLTIRAGDTNFQILKDRDYRQMKKKELQKYVEDHLEKAYGSIPDQDQFQYEVREDGTLLLVSYEERPYLLKLLENTRHLYSGKLKIMQMLPDESTLLGLIRKNYELDENEITCVIHLGFNRSRVFFMRGMQILHTISPIDEGKGSTNVLDVVFSKILFQLDTGKLPGLDRILITNNDLNGTSVEYFRKQFPDVKVGEYRFDPKELQIPSHLEPVSVFFTSAIGAAWSAAELNDTDFSEYSMLPFKIKERQNVLKLRWHGIILLMMLLATPVGFNYLYQQKQSQIYDMTEELNRTEMGIKNLEPVVLQSNHIQEMYQAEQKKMDLLNNLSKGIYYWSHTLKTLNDGLGNIKHVWISQVKNVDDGFMLQGYSMTRDRIPKVTNLFKRADLKAVSATEMRNVKLYKFTIKVYYYFTDDLESIYKKVEFSSIR